MNLRWSSLARADVLAIVDHLLEFNPAAAGRLIDTIEGDVHGLAEFPGMGRPGRCAGTRELVITDTPYIVVYRVVGGTVQILRVLHGARQWPESL